ncbi:MAG: undecaprenyl-phosphate glucose phosphotransferase [Erysipelotrichaceae bacterium]|nr:undecaprenyl-phosphate glucose phosphotransferase [Erysipelotrichaceae bacterium]
MIKRNQPILNLINILLDGVLLYVSYFIASWLRFGVLQTSMSLQRAWLPRYRGMFLVYSALALAIFYISGVYASVRKRRLRDEAAQILRLNLIGIVLFTSFQYFTKAGVFSRLTYVFYFLISSFLLILKRLVVKKVLYHFRTSGRNLKHVVVVGNGHLARQYIESIRKNPAFGYQIDGYVSKRRKEGLGTNLGSYEDLPQILEKNEVDELVVALEPHETKFMKQIIAATEKQGTKISVIPFYNDYLPAHPVVEEIDDVKLFSVHATPFDDPLNGFMKRTTDIIFSLILIILTSPVMLLTAIGIKLTGGPGPIIFKQQRVGRNKKLFTMYKFRSMKVNDTETTGWSQDRDSRKTRFGSFIRKFSIDELPQFFNVLKGDMSLIGPRPEVPYYVDQFKEEIPLYMIRHLVRPGITGWAQVNGYRGNTSIKKRIEYDIWYIEHWSIQLDFAIVMRTIFGGIINSEKVGKQK